MALAFVIKHCDSENCECREEASPFLDKRFSICIGPALQIGVTESILPGLSLRSFDGHAIPKILTGDQRQTHACFRPVDKDGTLLIDQCIVRAEV